MDSPDRKNYLWLANTKPNTPHYINLYCFNCHTKLLDSEDIFCVYENNIWSKRVGEALKTYENLYIGNVSQMKWKGESFMEVFCNKCLRKGHLKGRLFLTGDHSGRFMFCYQEVFTFLIAGVGMPVEQAIKKHTFVTQQTLDPQIKEAIKLAQAEIKEAKEKEKMLKKMVEEMNAEQKAKEAELKKKEQELQEKEEFIRKLQQQQVKLQKKFKSLQKVVKKSSNSSDVTWYWKDENNIWKEFEEEIQSEIEERYKRNEPSFIIKSKNDNTTYVIGFANMKRYNVELKTSCDIQRVEMQLRKPPKTRDFPGYWSPFKNYKMEELDLNSSIEAAWISHAFYETMSKDLYVLSSLYRIQHLGRWQQYQACHKMLQSISNSKEKNLFHGTSCDKVWQIIDEQNLTGLDPRFNETAVYGWGCYFATNASLSHVYCTPSTEGYYYMLLCRVSPGKYTIGESYHKRPPDGFDSTVDNIENPRIFVISLHTQIYVEYMLIYKMNIVEID